MSLQLPLLESGCSKENPVPALRAQWKSLQLLLLPLLMIGVQDWWIGQAYPEVVWAAYASLGCLGSVIGLTFLANLYLSHCIPQGQMLYLFFMCIEGTFLMISIVLYQVIHPSLVVITHYACGSALSAYLVHLLLSLLILLPSQI